VGVFFPLVGVLACSTLMTSVWIFVTVMASAVLKIIAPIQTFVEWFFPIDRHPIRAIGLVAGLMIWVGSVLIAVL
jgi:hypothetical protein